MSDFQPIFAKYVFLDVVRFSPRTDDAQAQIISNLNLLVQSALNHSDITEESSRLLLPTGDGVCIALLNPNIYDCHLGIALNFLNDLDVYNESTTDEEMRFEVRIGINQNWDITFQDINNNRNLAGAGINLAARLLGFGDANQIFVSEAVVHELQPKQKYRNSFRRHTKMVKHGEIPTAYQYIGSDHRGLNTKVASTFNPALPELSAYYFAHAIINRDAILSALGTSNSSLTAHAIVIVLYLLAKHSIEKTTATETHPSSNLWQDDLGFEEQISKYSRTDMFKLNLAFAERVFFDQLGKYEPKYIESRGSIYALMFVSDKGKQKLRNEWPAIWNEFHLDNVASA